MRKSFVFGAALFLAATCLGQITIDPQDIKPGTVDSIEFGYLNGVTSPIQQQIDSIIIGDLSWGVLLGTISNQTDLWSQLTNRYTKAEIGNLLTSLGTNNWNTAYSWGDHATNGYLITGDIGSWTNLSQYNNDAGFITNYVSTEPIFTNWLSTNSYVQIETDPIWDGVSNLYALVSSIPTNNNQLLNGANYLITGAAGSTTNLSDYNNDVPFLTSYVETDPLWGAISNATLSKLAGIAVGATSNSLASSIVDFDFAVSTNALVAGAAQLGSYNVFASSNSFNGAVYLDIDATAGKEAVNFQTLTNHLATGIDYDIRMGGADILSGADTKDIMLLAGAATGAGSLGNTYIWLLATNNPIESGSIVIRAGAGGNGISPGKIGFSTTPEAGGVPTTRMLVRRDGRVDVYHEATNGYEVVNYQTMTSVVESYGYITDAPSNGTQYARQDGAWAVVSGGGAGTVTNLRQYMYLNPSLEFADGPVMATSTNSAIGRTIKVAEFAVAEDRYSDMVWYHTEPNWNGLINIQGEFWNDGTTNTTTTWTLRCYDPLLGSYLGIVTGGQETIQFDSGVNVRQRLNATVDLSGIVTTNAGGFGLRFGWLGTNAVPDTRTGDNIQEYFSGALVY